LSLSIEAVLDKYRAVHRGCNDAKIERFRAEWLGKDRIDQIGDYVWLFDSYERLLPLIGATWGESPEVFWPLFLEWWNMCDGGSWALSPVLLSLLRKKQAERSAIEFMKQADREAFEAMKDPMICYRGCGKAQVRGFSWTTDRSVAEKFARGGRFPTPPTPVIASAMVKKSAIFFICNDRKESEIVVDPKRLSRPKIEYAESVEPDVRFSGNRLSDWFRDNTSAVRGSARP
jgi:hypothetical protein